MDRGPIQTSKQKIAGKVSRTTAARPTVVSQQSAHRQLAQCQCKGQGVVVRSAPPIRSRNKVRRLDSDVQQSPAFGGAFFLPPLPNWWPTTASSSTSGACPSAKTGRTTTIRTITGSSTPDLVHLNQEAPTRRCRPPVGVPNPANHTRSGTCAEPTTRTIGMCGGWHDATFALLSLQGSGDGAHHRLTRPPVLKPGDFYGALLPPRVPGNP
jgi:hypothetical protein